MHCIGTWHIPRILELGYEAIRLVFTLYGKLRDVCYNYVKVEGMILFERKVFSVVEMEFVFLNAFMKF